MSGRSKRQAKVLEENYWDCSLCTYRNSVAAFKCRVCDVRKGTSTRKPRMNPQLAAQQYTPAPPTKTSKTENDQKEKTDKKTAQQSKSEKKSWSPPRLTNVDRSSGETQEITVNNITVLITEYQPTSKSSNDAAETGSTCSISSESGVQSDSSADRNSTDKESSSS